MERGNSANGEVHYDEKEKWLSKIYKDENLEKHLVNCITHRAIEVSKTFSSIFDDVLKLIIKYLCGTTGTHDIQGQTQCFHDHVAYAIQHTSRSGG